jgi:hypothetical protein
MQITIMRDWTPVDRRSESEVRVREILVVVAGMCMR